MRTFATLAAAALFVAASAGASLAVAADDQSNDDNSGFDFATVAAPTTTFDLGIDVTGVTQTPGAVKGFLGSLAPETRGVLLTTCEHYMDHPVSARDLDTLAFCAAAVGG